MRDIITRSDDYLLSNEILQIGPNIQIRTEAKEVAAEGTNISISEPHSDRVLSFEGPLLYNVFSN